MIPTLFIKMKLVIQNRVVNNINLDILKSSSVDVTCELDLVWCQCDDELRYHPVVKSSFICVENGENELKLLNRMKFYVAESKKPQILVNRLRLF